MKIFIKKDNNILEVEETITETKKVSYDYGFLLEQKESIKKQITLAEIELQKVEEFILEADKLGITKAKVIIH